MTGVERPKAVDGERQIQMELAAEVQSAGEVRVTGAASDPQAAIGSGVDAVDVWAMRENGPGGEQVMGDGAAVSSLASRSPLCGGVFRV